MRTTLLVAWTLLAVPTGSPSAEVTAARLRDEALGDSRAIAILRELTTRFGPRPAGSASERAAAEWCAAQMRGAGLANVRIESFPIQAWVRGAERAEILAPFSQTLSATALGGTDPTPPMGVEGEVVVFATLDALQAAPAGSLAGKIALLNYQMPRLESGVGYNLATRGRGEGPGEAAKRGAVAFLLRSAGTGRHRFPHTGSTRFDHGRVPIPAFALAAADADQLVRLGAQGPVRVRLFSSGHNVPDGKSQNVIGDIPGRTGEHLVIGAHLDSWDLGTGAVDDGAGVAIVLAAAERLTALGHHPRRGIRVVLFGAEEINQPAAPLFIPGAYAYAAAHADEIPRYAIASESDLGAGRAYALSLPDGWRTSDLAAAAARVLLPLGVLLDSETAPHGGADMLPLQQAGVPVFLFKQDASEYFDLHHTGDDTFDKVDPDALRQLVAAWTAWLYLVAESDADFRRQP